MTDPALLLAFAVLAFWTLLLLDRSRRWPAELFLDPNAAPAAAQSVAVIVPARDEAAVLPLTLPSLLVQRNSDLQVVLVDDGSGDGTTSVAAEIAAGVLAGRAPSASRFQSVRTEATPRGWSGKVFALETGLRAIDEGRVPPPEWLLLTDADIRHPPSSVDSLLAMADCGGYDLVSVMARLHCVTVWERVVIPAFVFYFQLLYPFRSVRDRVSPVAAAAGGCILVRRRTLRQVGGFAAIRDAVIDDVALAKALKKAGSRLWLGFDDRIVSVRSYETLGGLWRMVSRSAFVQLRYRYELVLLVVLGLVVFFVSPPLLATIAGARLLRQPVVDPVAVRILAVALAAWLIQFRCLHPYVRHHRVPFWYAFLLPLAALLYAGMTVSSGWNHLRGRGVRWRGREYDR